MTSLTWRRFILFALAPMTLAFAILALGSSPTGAKVSSAELKLQVRGLPKAIGVAKTRKFRLRVTNSGRAGVRSVRVRLKGTRGLILRPAKRTFKRLRPGQTETINVTVRANRRARARSRIALQVSAGRTKPVRQVRVIRIARRGSGTKPNPATGRVTSPVGHYFWALEPVRVDRSSNATGFYFANDRFVHVGIPERGLPVCSRARFKRDGDGKIESGCVRYTFNQRNGRLVIGGQIRGKFVPKRGKSSVEIDGKSFYIATIPAAGTKLQVTLTHRGYRGFCGLITGCTTWKENLGLDRQGRFVRSRSSITSVGGHGAPFIWGANFPPDEYGHYRILSNGRIQFRYMDGSVSVETVAIQHSDRGRPDAGREGLVLNDIWFYLEDED